MPGIVVIIGVPSNPCTAQPLFIQTSEIRAPVLSGQLNEGKTTTHGRVSHLFFFILFPQFKFRLLSKLGSRWFLEVNQENDIH